MIMSDARNTNQRRDIMKTKITLTNDFHNTSVNVMVNGEPGDYEYRLSSSQVRRIRRELCGMADCSCGAVRNDEWLLNDCPGLVPTLECK
jgi:hypothetical protein